MSKKKKALSFEQFNGFKWVYVKDSIKLKKGYIIREYIEPLEEIDGLTQEYLNIFK